MVVDLLIGVFQWIWKPWNRLDDKTKRQIIDSVVDSFQDLLRSFYQQWKDSKQQGDTESESL